jgi:polar amino acid transport system substrate-binding protein
MPSRIFCYMLFLSFLSLSLFKTENLHAETITLSSPPIPPVSGDAPEPAYLKVIVAEAGHRIGLDILFKSEPAQRSLVSSNSGRTDGELHRIEGLEKLYPNLIRVPEPILFDQFVGFSAEPNVYIKDWKNTSPLKISYPRGWYIYSKAFGEDAAHQPGLDAYSLFRMAERKRIDIAMHTLDKGSYIADHEHIKVYPVSPPFAVVPMYIYLNKSKENLVPKLAAALHELKEDGTYARIKKEILFKHGLTQKAYFQSPLDKPAN